MDSLLIKQIGTVLKHSIPNISVTPDDKNIHKLYFSFYYKRDDINNIYPRLFFDPNVEVENNPIFKDSVTYYGEIDLENYPNKSPQTLLYGNVPHCHIYCMKGLLYKICFSLDRSYEWYFASHTSSLFNPSMSLLYYITNIYKFIGEDDRTHTVSIDRIKNSYKYWIEYKPEFKIEPPEIIIDFTEAIKIHSSIIYPDSRNEQLDKLKEIYSDDILKIVLSYTDYIDKKYIVLDFEPYVLPISYNINELRKTLKISSLDIISYKYYKSGIRKTSFGKNFTNCLPIVINSKLWNVDTFKNIIKNEMINVFIHPSPTIFNGEDFDEIDIFIYYILGVFNGTFYSIMKGKGISDTSIKGIMYIHHIFIYLIDKLKWFKERINYLLDTHQLEVNSNFASTLGIIALEKNTAWKKYLITMFNKTLEKAIMDHIKIKTVISLDKDNNLRVSDRYRLIDILWINGHRNFQRVLFQKLYNEKCFIMDLEYMDNCYGGIAPSITKEIKILLDNIFYFKALDGKQGFEKTLELLEIDMTVEELLDNGIIYASENINTDNLISKWTYVDRELSTYYNPYPNGCNDYDL